MCWVSCCKWYSNLLTYSTYCFWSSIPISGPLRGALQCLLHRPQELSLQTYVFTVFGVYAGLWGWGLSSDGRLELSFRCFLHWELFLQVIMINAMAFKLAGPGFKSSQVFNDCLHSSRELCVHSFLKWRYSCFITIIVSYKAPKVDCLILIWHRISVLPLPLSLCG